LGHAGVTHDGLDTTASALRHPYYMHDAIYAQPGALRCSCAATKDALAGAAARLRRWTE